MKAAYTARQGQFLAYIHQYSVLNGRAPAEADMQPFFQVTPPSVHQMVLTLKRQEFIRRVPGQAGSITLIVPPESLPQLKRPEARDFQNKLRYFSVSMCSGSNHFFMFTNRVWAARPVASISSAIGQI